MSTTQELQLTNQNSQVTEARELCRVRPHVDLLESDHAWMLRAEMPGVDEEHVEVSLERRILTIRGTSQSHEPEGYKRQFGEFRPRCYERMFQLPDEIQRDKIEASMADGLLTVTIPKADEALPAKITVKSAKS